MTDNGHHEDADDNDKDEYDEVNAEDNDELRVHSFGITRIRMNDPRSLGHRNCLRNIINYIASSQITQLIMATMTIVVPMTMTKMTFMR